MFGRAKPTKAHPGDGIGVSIISEIGKYSGIKIFNQLIGIELLTSYFLENLGA